MAWGFCNLNGGGGLSSAYAYVYVEYDSGVDEVICTNSRGSVDVTETSKIFRIVDGATSCTLTSKRGNSIIAERTVPNIVEFGSYCVRLTSILTLSNLGDPYLDSAGGWALSSAKSASSGVSWTPVKPYISHNYGTNIGANVGTGKYGGLVRTKRLINLNNYTSLKFIGKNGAPTNSNVKVSLVILPSDYTYWGTGSYLKAVDIYAQNTYTINVSSITSDCYIGIGLSSNQGESTASVTIDRMWLE